MSWLGFSYLFVLYTKMGLARSIHNFPWHSDAPLWIFRYCLMGAAITIFTKWKFGLLTETSKSLLRDFIILILLIPLNSFLIEAFHIQILGITYSGGERPIEFDWVMGFLSGCITQTFVSMMCIGYFYLTLVNTTKEKLTQAQRAKSEMELKTLQQKVDPHFLFNNLNVLSLLIEKNPQTANEFLDKLAQLYRYILHTNNAEVVSIKEELDFAENYMYLLQMRFGTAYNFDWQISKSKINGQMIVPTALQSLLENVVKHNAGSGKNPLRIRVKLDEQFLIVENEIRPKSPNGEISGTGLQNLRARYVLLTENPLEIVQSGNIFTVKIPLLEMKKMRVAVIEDEPLAAEKLCDFIARYDVSINVAAKLESVAETKKWFRANKPPDLIFSDIELLDGNVFEFLEDEELTCPIIFTTAYDRFLLPAFERNGIAYLLKPFTYENFVAAMLKLEKLKQNLISAQTDIWREIQKKLAAPPHKERFVIKSRGGIQIIETNKIAYFQMRDGLLFAFDADGGKFPISENLNRLEEILDPQMFFRINRGEIVNLQFIERLAPYFNDRLTINVKNSKIKLVSSTNRTPNLRKWIEGESPI